LFDAYKQLDQSVVDFQKIKSIKESYPDDYRDKLEKNYQVLEQKIQKLKRTVLNLKKENTRLKDWYASLEFVNKWITHALEKANL